MSIEDEAKAAAEKRYPWSRGIPKNANERRSNMLRNAVRMGYAEGYIAGANSHTCFAHAVEPAPAAEREVLAQASLDSERLRQIAEWLSMEQGHDETAKRVVLIADRHDRLAAGFHRHLPHFLTMPGGAAYSCGCPLLENHGPLGLTPEQIIKG